MLPRLATLAAFNMDLTTMHRIAYAIPALLIGLLSACSGGGGGSSGPSGAPPVPPNAAPSITISSDFEVQEGITDVGSFGVSDADGDALEVTIRGDDVALFQVQERVLSFVARPDFDRPRDTDQNNVYELSIVVSDGVSSTSVDIIVRVTSAPFDEISRVLDVHSVARTTDLDGDELDDLIVLPEPVVASDALPSVEPGPGAVALAITRRAVAAESANTFTLDELGDAAATIEFTADQAFSAFAGNPFWVAFDATGDQPVIKTDRLIPDAGDPSSTSDSDMTAIFPEAFNTPFQIGATLDLSNDVLPAGIRSTRAQVAVSLDDGRMIGGEFVPAGDFNGDGVSDALGERSLRARFGDPDLTLVVLDGQDLTAGSSTGLFSQASNTMLDDFRANGARAVVFPSDDFVASSDIDALRQVYREPGSADVDGDGVDDVYRILGLPDAAPAASGTPDGYEIYLFSGASLMSLPTGSYTPDSLTSGSRFIIEVPQGFSTPVVEGIGDVDGDGHADIVIRTLSRAPPNDLEPFEIYVVSGRALVSAPDGVLSLGDFPGPGGTGIRASNGAFYASDVFIAGKILGGSGDSIIISDSESPSPGTSRIVSLITTDAMFESGFPERIDFGDPSSGSLDAGIGALPVGSYVRINGPASELYSATSPDGLLITFGYGRAFVRPSSTGIGDADGDGVDDLAIIIGEIEPFSNVELSGVVRGDLYLIPSRVLIDSKETGETIDLESIFGE